MSKFCVTMGGSACLFSAGFLWGSSSELGGEDVVVLLDLECGLFLFLSLLARNNTIIKKLAAKHTMYNYQLVKLYATKLKHKCSSIDSKKHTQLSF